MTLLDAATETPALAPSPRPRVVVSGATALFAIAVGVLGLTAVASGHPLAGGPHLPRMTWPVGVACLCLGAGLGGVTVARPGALVYRMGCLLALVALIVVTGAVALGVPEVPASTTVLAGLVAISLLLRDSRRPRRRRAAEILAVLAALLSLVALAGYAVGVGPLPSVVRVLWDAELSLPGALAVLALSVGVLAAVTDGRVASGISSRLLGGAVARRFVIAGVALPLAGLLLVAGERAGLYESAIPTAFVVAGMLGMVALGLVTARRLDRIDAERRWSAAALREREELYRALVEQASIGIYVVDLDGRFIQLNPLGCAMLGYTPDELLGTRIGDLLRPEHDEKRAAARAVLARGEVLYTEWEAVRKDGTVVPLDVSAKVLTDGRVQIIARDISEKRRARDELERAHEALKELERSREEWASIVAHEIRQPLGTISLSAQVLVREAEGAPEDSRSRGAGRILTAASRLNRMIDDLVDVSRIEARQLQLEVRPVHLRGLISDVVERLLLEARVVLDERGEPRPVEVDEVRIEQVVANLLTNAIKYGEPSSKVGVSIAWAEGEVAIAVENRGRGISREEQDKLFSRFSRTREARASGASGLGLGLYICRGIIEAHGGRITVESTPGEITRFTVTLPAPQLTRVAGLGDSRNADA